MSSKVELVTVNTPLNSSSFQQQINNNFTAIEESLNKQLQREPQEGVNNAMQQEIDMNSNRIINLAEPVNPSDAARFKEVQDVQGYAQEAKDARDEAVQAKEDAVDAKEAAEDAKTDAVDAKEDAESARDTAVQAKDDAVAAKDDITTLLTEDYPEITTVANNISDVQTVAAGISDVSTVAGVATEVAAVGAITADVTTVAGNTSDISTVAGISSDVSAVAGVASDISTVEGIASDVTTVAGIASDVTTVAGNASNVSTVAGMSSDISDVVTNMTAIQGASQNASDAADSATLAQEWATKMDGQVASTDYSSKYYASQAATSASSASTNASLAEDWATKTDGLVAETDYSSKYYAQQAAAIVATLGNVLVYKGSVATYADLPATGNHTGDVWNVLADGKNYAWDGTAWDDFGGAVTVSIATASDVSLTNLQNGQVLIYNSMTQKWENGTVSGGASSLTDIAVAGDNVTFTPPPYSTTYYTVVGSPTISSSFVASGFSDSNYLTCPNIINNASSSFELVTAVSLSSASNNNNGIFDTSGSTTHNIRLTTSATNTVRLRITTDGSETYPVDITGTTTFTVGQKLFIKCTYDSTTGYALYTSTDGATWNPEGTSATTTRPYSSANSEIMIGDNAATGMSLNGSLYLEDSYINVNNGEYEWHAVETETTKTKINAAIPSGVLTNTATGSNSLSILGSATSQSNAVNVGVFSSAGYTGAVAIGKSATANGNYAIAIGNDASAGGFNSIYIGRKSSNSYYATSESISIGFNASTTASYSVALGNSATANTNNGVAIGNTSLAGAQGCVAVGYGAIAGNSMSCFNSIAIGREAKTQATYAIQLGYGTNSNANTFSVGLSSSLNVQLLDSTGTIPFARQAQAIIEGASDPTTATVGTVGLLYRNTTDGGIFKCTDTTGSVYTWEELGAGGGGSSIAKETYTNPALIASDNYCTWTITHGLNTKDVVVSVYRADDDVEPMVNIIHRTTSTVIVVFNSSADIAAGAYKAVIIG